MINQLLKDRILILENECFELEEELEQTNELIKIQAQTIENQQKIIDLLTIKTKQTK